MDLRSFETEWKQCRLGQLENVPVRVLPLPRVIASKRAANREKDRGRLPILEELVVPDAVAGRFGWGMSRR